MMNENVLAKLKILAESAKYDVSCSSSGTVRSNKPGTLGNTVGGWGICHSFAEDGRCTLKTQNYIHRFFEKNAGKEFVGYYQGNISKEIDRKVCRWHLFPKSFKETEGGLAVTKRVLRAGCVRLQSLLGIRRNKDINFRKGTQWLSISNELVGYLLQQQKEVRRVYTHTFCADEIFVQTICWNSSFRDRVYDMHDEGHGCLRMIGWKDNQLEEWKEKDFEILMNSEALFARKFSIRHAWPDCSESFYSRTRMFLL